MKPNKLRDLRTRLRQLFPKLSRLTRRVVLAELCRCGLYYDEEHEVLLHRLRERWCNADMAFFMTEYYAVRHKYPHGATTKEIIRITNGKASSDGTTYGLLLGWLKKIRRKSDGKWVYVFTQLGLDIATGKAKVPEHFLYIHRRTKDPKTKGLHLLAVSIKTCYLQSIGAIPMRIADFTADRVDLYRIVGLEELTRLA